MHLSPQPAATLVCCNVTTKWPYKVLLLRRSDQSAFLPGAYVFPGGRLEKKDELLAAWLSRDEKNRARLASYFPADYPFLAMLACALRESLEEADISVAKIIKEGHSCTLAPSSLAKVIESEAMPEEKADLSHLWPISWWVTPEGEKRRFDTHFFLGLVETENEAFAISGKETEKPCWLCPKEALKLYEEGIIFLAPPTRAVLERLASAASFDALITELDQKLAPICPYFVEEQEKKLLVLPGDSLHHDQERKSSFIMKTRYFFP